MLILFTEGANGDGMAIVSSLRSFDREQQKEYLIPIVIKDHGNPAMSGTSTLTVVIGDVNDNKMQPGSKEIFVYNYQGQAPETEIGRVYVYDLDDWDLPDKKFYWESTEHPRFKLNEETGMVLMKHGTKDGKYNLRFKVRIFLFIIVVSNTLSALNKDIYNSITFRGKLCRKTFRTLRDNLTEY